MEATRPIRAIVGARTSVTNKDKVSHHAQRESGDRHCEANGWTIVDHFKDLGVSATISPWDRESLGPWLDDDYKDSYDAVVWSKVDRAFRSAKDCADLAHWAEQNHKVLVFVDDGLTLDYRPHADTSGFGGMMAEVFVMLASIFAQLELRRYQVRAKDAHGYLRTRDRWASGVPPLGFMTVPHLSGYGKTLATDQEGKEILQDMAKRLLAGDSYTTIADYLNKSKARTNMGRTREGKEDEDGNPLPPPIWTADNVKRALTTLRTQGVKMSGDKPVMDAEGHFIRMADPTFDDATWDRIQDKAGERSMSGKRRAVSANPILGVGFCECGASLTRKVRRKHAYYRCGRTPKACKGIGIKQAEAHELLERIMTQTFGGVKATRRVFVPGTDNAAELETVNASVSRLHRESDAGLIVTDTEEEEWLGRLTALTARKRDLESTPVRAAGWETVQEDETYQERYSIGDDTERRSILRNAGIRLTLHADSEPTLTPPDQVADLVGDHIPVSMLGSDEWLSFLAAAIQSHIEGEEVFVEDDPASTFVLDDGSVVTVPKSFLDGL